MRIDINLATRPYEDSRQFWVYWGTGLALLAIATLLMLFITATGFMRARGDRAQLSKLEEQIAAYDREKAQAEAVLNQPQNRELRDQSRFLNELFERKAFSWTRVFEDLEQVMPAHLRVISIHPNVSGDNNVTIKLVVGGESQMQALDLVRKMENSQHFKQTRIDASQSTDNPGTEDRVRVEIETAYAPLTQDRPVSGGMN
ncbi:MAG TPA: PilN domain-containing protein [Terriglobales bacterium]|jgi:type IV pilus assembly protein PilN|nr:PilN domain-containing protein [Terriglobales bacterium]